VFYQHDYLSETFLLYNLGFDTVHAAWSQAKDRRAFMGAFRVCNATNGKQDMQRFHLIMRLKCAEESWKTILEFTRVTCASIQNR